VIGNSTEALKTLVGTNIRSAPALLLRGLLLFVLSGQTSTYMQTHGCMGGGQLHAGAITFLLCQIRVLQCDASRSGWLRTRQAITQVMSLSSCKYSDRLQDAH
jgi:hypothetical protein